MAGTKEDEPVGLYDDVSEETSNRQNEKEIFDIAAAKTDTQECPAKNMVGDTTSPGLVSQRNEPPNAQEEDEIDPNMIIKNNTLETAINTGTVKLLRLQCYVARFLKNILKEFGENSIDNCISYLEWMREISDLLAERFSSEPWAKAQLFLPRCGISRNCARSSMRRMCLASLSCRSPLTPVPGEMFAQLKPCSAPGSFSLDRERNTFARMWIGILMWFELCRSRAGQSSSHRSRPGARPHPDVLPARSRIPMLRSLGMANRS